jgi:hypothetical protein
MITLTNKQIKFLTWLLSRPLSAKYKNLVKTILDNGHYIPLQRRDLNTLRLVYEGMYKKDLNEMKEMFIEKYIKRNE